MSPVEQTSTSPAETPSACADRSAVACVIWKPSAPGEAVRAARVEHDRRDGAVGDDLLRPEDRVRLRAVRREHRGGVLQRAAVDDEREVEAARRLEAGGDARGVEARRAAVTLTGRLRSREGPVVSGRPRAMLADWMAAPAVPLTRLSIALTTTTRSARSSTARPISAVLAPTASAVRGKLPAGQHVHERLVGVGRLPGLAHVVDASPRG